MRSQSRSKSPASRRDIINQMTIPQLRALARKHNISLPAKTTKTGIGSRIMSSLSKQQIQAYNSGKASSSRSKTPVKKPAKKSTRRSVSPCPKKKQTITRKAYTRADGTKVKATTYCINK